MAYHISVYRRSDMAWVNDPPPELQGDFDRWMVELAARTLYENPLGAGHVVFEYWSALGSSLGLPLIAGIYGEGLEAEGHALDRLIRELDELERAWGALDLNGEDEFVETIHRPDRGPETRSLTLADHLRQRMRSMREAIRVAHEANGYLIISRSALDLTVNGYRATVIDNLTLIPIDRGLQRTNRRTWQSSILSCLAEHGLGKRRAARFIIVR